MHTDKVINSFSFEHVYNQVVNLPHLLRDLTACETVDQIEDFFVEIWIYKQPNCTIVFIKQSYPLRKNEIFLTQTSPFA